MITDKIQNLHRYMGISSNLDIALNYLMSHDIRNIDEHMEINGNEVYINRQTLTLVSFPERAWENHFSYIDIHVAIEGSEILGYLNDPDSLHWSDVNMEKDCEISRDAVDAPTVSIKPGMCAIVWPGEPHKPNIGEGTYTKLVVKVRT